MTVIGQYMYIIECKGKRENCCNYKEIRK